MSEPFLLNEETLAYCRKYKCNDGMAESLLGHIDAQATQIKQRMKDVVALNERIGEWSKACSHYHDVIDAQAVEVDRLNWLVSRLQTQLVRWNDWAPAIIEAARGHERFKRADGGCQCATCLAVRALDKPEVGNAAD